MCSWVITYHHWGKCMLESFVHLKTELFLTLLSCENSLYFMDTSPLPDMIYKYFLTICVLPLHFFFLVSFVTQSFWFDKNQFIYFPFIVCAFCVVSKKLLPNLRFGRFTPMFSL